MDGDTWYVGKFFFQQRKCAPLDHLNMFQDFINTWPDPDIMTIFIIFAQSL